MYLGLIIILIAATIPFIQAEATPVKKVIGVIIETSLQKSGKMNYSDLWYLDKSNKFVSGEIKDGVRSCAKVKNAISWYSFNRFNDTTIIIDPCITQKNYMPHITIVSQLNNYFKLGQMTVKEIGNTTIAKATKDTRAVSHTWYVDDTCNRGTIGYSENWKPVLIQTINYISHGCDEKYVKINNISYENRTITKHDYTTSAKYKLEKFYHDVKKNCSKARNSCTDIQNKAVITNGDSK